MDMGCSGRFDLPGRVLVVGSCTVCGKMQLDLSSMRHEVLAIPHSQNLFATLSEFKPDVAILVSEDGSSDIYALCTRIKDDPGLSEIGIMLIAPPGDDGVQIQGFECGANDVLSAPVNPVVLVARVRVLMKYRHAVKQWRAAHDALEARLVAGKSELTRAERALQETEENLRQIRKFEALGQLAGGVAHDFNNLLCIILGYAGKIRAESLPGDPRAAYAEHIAKTSNRAAALTRQLLAFGRRQVLQPRVLDLHAKLKDLEPMLQRLLCENIRVEISGEAPLGRIRVDPVQIEQVILNLAVNARDAMPEGGTLAFKMRNIELGDAFAASHPGAKAGPHVLLSVSDTGTGMSRETLARLFEPFFTTKQSGKGTGLGLSTVYGIIKQSAGNIWVQSELGKGTRFDIYLPRIAKEPDAEPRLAPRRKAGGTETILVVEDEEAVRQLIADALERNGYRVIHAPDAEAGLGAAAAWQGPIALLLTDVMLPTGNGAFVAQKFKRLRPEAKVAFMSGHADDTIIRHGVLEPGVVFIQKPFTPEELLKKVREILDQNSASQQPATPQEGGASAISVSAGAGSRNSAVPPAPAAPSGAASLTENL